MALVASGMATDALALAEAARRECLAHRYIYDSPINVGRLVTKLAQQVHETERARIVPYAVDLLVAGVDGEAGGRPRLYNIGPAGVYGSYRACAVGREADKARRVLMEAELGGAGGGGMAGLRRLAGTVLRALMLTGVCVGLGMERCMEQCRAACVSSICVHAFDLTWLIPSSLSLPTPLQSRRRRQRVTTTARGSRTRAARRPP